MTGPGASLPGKTTICPLTEPGRPWPVVGDRDSGWEAAMVEGEVVEGTVADGFGPVRDEFAAVAAGKGGDFGTQLAARAARDNTPAKLPANDIDANAQAALLRVGRRGLQMVLRLLTHNASTGCHHT